MTDTTSAHCTKSEILRGGQEVIRIMTGYKASRFRVNAAQSPFSLAERSGRTRAAQALAPRFCI